MKWFILVIIVLVMLPLTYASASMHMNPLDEKTLKISQGQKYSFDIDVSGSSHLVTYITGDLLDVTHLIDKKQNGGERTITIVVDIPRDYPTGKYILKAAVLEPYTIYKNLASANYFITVVKNSSFNENYDCNCSQVSLNPCFSRNGSCYDVCPKEFESFNVGNGACLSKGEICCIPIKKVNHQKGIIYTNNSTENKGFFKRLFKLFS